MRWLAKISLRMRSLFHRRAADDELDAELRSHLERQIAANVSAGMSQAEARRTAMREFGGVEQLKEECRDMRKVNWLQDFAQDLRYGLRMLRKSPAFTTIAVLTLALGIGANTAIFSAVNGILLEPYLYAWSSRLLTAELLSIPEIRTIQGQSTAFERTAIYQRCNILISGVSLPEQVNSSYVSDDFFPLLGVKPLLGRPILPEDTQPGHALVAVLSYRLWMGELGGDPHIIGRAISVDHKPYTVVGVMPKGFDLGVKWGEGNDGLWMPFVYSPLDSVNQGPFSSFVARLKEGVSLSEAKTQLKVISARLASEHPKEHRSLVEGYGMIVTAGANGQIAPVVRIGLLILLGAVGFVLLMACVNVTSLLVARAWTRQKELAIRRALGATRLRIVRQLLSETLLLAIAGGTLGLFFSLWGIRLLRVIAPPYTPRVDHIRLDGNVLWFTMGLSLLAAVLVGLLPALHASSRRMGGTLKGGLVGSFAGVGTRRSHRVRSALVVLEVTLAVIVEAGGALMARSFYKLLRVDTGVRADHVLTMSVHLSDLVCNNKDWGAKCMLATKNVLDGIRSLPGVQRAALSFAGPLQGGGIIQAEHYPGEPSGSGLYVEGRQGNQLTSGAISGRPVTPGFFATLGISILKGRDFEPGDYLRTSPPVAVDSQNFATKPGKPLGKQPSASKDKDKDGHHDLKGNDSEPGDLRNSLLVAIVSRGFADKYIPGNPLGKRFSTSEGNDGHHQWMEIVGVVNDVRDRAVKEFARPVYYTPFGYGNNQWEIMVRTSTDPMTMFPAMERVVRSADNDAPITNIETVDQIIANSAAEPRFQTVLLGSFGALGLLLAVIGIYGVVSYSVIQRTHEIGVRMALGAQRGDVLGMVIREGMTLAGAGIAIGIGGALALTRFLRSLLFEIKPTDPATFVGVAVLLALVALAACYVPARRAMRVDPMVALRYE